MQVSDYEQLGLFYLGRPVDRGSGSGGQGAPSAAPLLVDARHLTTHAVIVGMTGSGKTGLGITLLEEAAIDGIPSLVIDLKGDLANLALRFPSLSPAEFAPWLPAGASADEAAAAWQAGLAATGQDATRVARLAAAQPVDVYTPGSRAGRPLSVLRTFAAPPAGTAPELVRERAVARTSALLALLSIDADPLRSREHVLVTTLLEAAWAAGTSPTVAELIAQVQRPPIAQIGVFDLESFFPAKERFELAMALNTLLASPGFAAWAEGEPLDVARLLFGTDGRARTAVLSLAHLGDAQRMSFLTTLLAEVIAWMRTQPGTSSLRALLYLDEVFGYLPPVANPPSKPLLLTLLKQARAFGLGVVLATQNPVDLDYKALSNAGTWCIGRLQTERDTLRVLDGLEAAAAASGAGFDRAALAAQIGGLGKRRFVLHSVHERAPVVFECRHALSYLRGPLTREEVERLARAGASQAATAAPAPSAAPAAVAPAPVALGATGAARPVVPPHVTEFFLDAAPGDGPITYQPAVLASARVRYASPKLKLDMTLPVVLLAAFGEHAAIDFAHAMDRSASPPVLDKQPDGAATAWHALPAPAARAASWTAWQRAFAGHVVAARPLTVMSCPSLGAYGVPGEDEGAMRQRLALAARQARDAQVDKLRRKLAGKVATLEERLRKAEARVEREAAQASAQTVDTAVSVGATILGAMFGRRGASAATVGRARSAARSAGRMAQERGDVDRARADAAAARAQLAALEQQLADEVAAIDRGLHPASVAIDHVRVAAKKADVVIGQVALIWLPYRSGVLAG